MMITRRHVALIVWCIFSRLQYGEFSVRKSHRAVLSFSDVRRRVLKEYRAGTHDRHGRSAGLVRDCESGLRIRSQGKSLTLDQYGLSSTIPTVGPVLQIRLGSLHFPVASMGGTRFRDTGQGARREHS